MTDTNDLVKRLRQDAEIWGRGGCDEQSATCTQAADTIEALQARVEVLEKALEPFASCPSHGKNGGLLVHAQLAFEDGTGGEDIGKSPTWPGYIPHEWFSRARTALKGGE